ncbi:MAG: MarR family transcriptional regulator [Verrucomicrobia bacterium]|nr:MarR family transcriptional regulator [Verrucomicrobiota bacterium]
MATSSLAAEPRYEALLQLLRTADTLWNASRVFFARWNLSPSQFNVLNLLASHPKGLSQIELGRLLVMHRSNVTGLIDRLETRGLAQRRDHLTDRRAFVVVLTPVGKRLICQIEPHYRRAAAGVWGGVPVKRVNQLLSELVTVSANAERIAGEIAPKFS